MEEYPAITHVTAEAIPPKFRVYYDEPAAAMLIAGSMRERMHLYDLSTDRPRVILCIGTDRSTGDSLGPLVGSKVAALNNRHYHVYGTLAEPVHAANLKEKLREISLRHRNALIFAVDASLGYPENVGAINVGMGPLIPGAGVNKSLPPVGHIHITAVVNVGGFMEYVVLQNTRLSVVMRQAEVIADAFLRLAEEEKGPEQPLTTC
ncbi:MAG TPA: spore protease YyaC [Desulfotomaculum sp.]|nr:spore protease YyaC [Desulfotomaculum sp.]